MLKQGDVMKYRTGSKYAAEKYDPVRDMVTVISQATGDHIELDRKFAENYLVLVYNYTDLDLSTNPTP